MITVNFNSTGALSLAYLRGDIELEMGCRTEKICHSCGKPLEKFKHIYRTNMIPFCNSTCRARYKYQHDILYREKKKDSIKNRIQNRRNLFMSLYGDDYKIIDIRD